MKNENRNVMVINQGGMDRMAPVEEMPDLANLQQELKYAWERDSNAYALTVFKENTRYCRWAGQTNDGLKHREYMGSKAMPYDGAPDTRIFLTDGIINSLVDVLYQSFFSARVKTTPITAQTLTASQAAEWRAIISWMLHGPLRGGLIDDVEFAAQLTETIGWCALHPSWRKEKVLKLQTITMEELIQDATQALQALAQGQVQDQEHADMVEALAHLPALIMDPTTADHAAEVIQQFFPDQVNAKTAKRIVNDLRTTKQTQFPLQVDGPNIPVLRILVPGQHILIPPESTALPGEERWIAVRCFFSEATLRQRAQEEQWNEAFVEKVVKTKGLSMDEQTVEHNVDQQLRDIEIFYMYQRRVDEDGVPGMFCTVFSFFVNAQGGKATAPEDYGYHRLVNFGHDQYPFIVQQTEVTGLRPMDARGVPDVTLTAQQEMKNSRDLTYIYQQMSVVPPLQKTGSQASKLPPGLSPMGIVNNVNGGEWKWFAVPQSNPQIAFTLMEAVRKEMEDHFGIPRTDTPPSRSQARMARRIARWLSKWGEALWQLSVLAYQNLAREELTQILGRPPLLTTDIVVNQRLLLWFEVRSMDSDWLEKMIAQIIQLLQVDTGNSIDRSKLVQFVMAYMDPMLSEEVSLDQAGASQQMFKEVRDEINSIMQGNKPMLRQNDPTAQMKMMFAQQIIQGNPQFQLQLAEKLPNGMANPQFNPMAAENMKTYMANLQHNYQEMVTSKMQGRLGVSDVGGAPVASGQM